MARVVIVGGGIIGTMHAYFAIKAGHEVIQVERDSVAGSASVRNFGLIWVSGREVGSELTLALRSRQLWEEIGTRLDTIGFRANGSLTIASNAAEWEVMNRAAAMPDALLRGFELLTADEVRKLEPSLQGKFIGALLCSKDAAVEPNLLLTGLRSFLESQSGYQWIPNFEVVEYSDADSLHRITDIHGSTITGDYMALCTGAAHSGFLSEFTDGAPLRKVHLQMAATEPAPFMLKHSLADGDSLRYYPAFKDLGLQDLAPQPEIADRFKMQLLLVQRNDGSMTIGDTHEYVEPFTHEIYEEPYQHLQGVIAGIFGGPEPKIAKRWSGVYSQSTVSDIYYRKEIAPGAVIVTGGGGRGNTLAPAIAEETMLSWKI